MNEQEIDQAVKVFRDTLEKTYEAREFYGIGTHYLLRFFTGKISMHRLNNGNLKISGEIGKECISKKCVGLPREFDDWAIFPLVVTLFNKNFENERNKTLEGRA